MNAMRTIPSSEIEKDLLQQLKAIAKPGVVFSQPIRQGGYSVMTASAYTIRKDHFSARPIALILLKPDGVEIRKIYNLAQILGILIPLASAVSWAVVMLFHPPWHNESSLVDEVRKLVKSIRRRA